MGGRSSRPDRSGEINLLKSTINDKNFDLKMLHERVSNLNSEKASIESQKRNVEQKLEASQTKYENEQNRRHQAELETIRVQGDLAVEKNETKNLKIQKDAETESLKLVLRTLIEENDFCKQQIAIKDGQISNYQAIQNDSMKIIMQLGESQTKAMMAMAEEKANNTSGDGNQNTNNMNG